MGSVCYRIPRSRSLALPRFLIACIALVALPQSALGDAIVRTQAMTASTIAEIFVEEGRVRVELEIGERDCLVAV